MPEMDKQGWTFVGRTSSTDFYEVRPGILACVPFSGLLDTAATAAESSRFLHHYLSRHGRGAVVAVLDPPKLSHSPTRRLYLELDASLVSGVAVVVSSALARAVGAVVLGITRASYPIKMFGRLERALVWVDAMSVGQGAAATT